MELLAAILVFLVSYRVMLTSDFIRDSEVIREKKKEIYDTFNMKTLPLFLCIKVKVYVGL